MVKEVRPFQSNSKFPINRSIFLSLAQVVQKVSRNDTRMDIGSIGLDAFRDFKEIMGKICIEIGSGSAAYARVTDMDPWGRS